VATLYVLSIIARWRNLSQRFIAPTLQRFIDSRFTVHDSRCNAFTDSTRSEAAMFRHDPIFHPRSTWIRIKFICWQFGRLVCVLLSQCQEFMKDRLRILTVEDEPAVTKMLALLLGGPAAKVTSASDGWMALMKIGAAAEPFDVIITDHRMRRVNGLELVRRLRVRKFAGKIIVLSAHLTKENIRAYEELNVDMMLAKPFDVEELQLAMNLLTKKPSASVSAPMAAPA
jgi:CheY-like chemotaxis protein